MVEPLRLDGHEVIYVSELDPTISDESVLELANQTGSLLITEDKDFGELIFHQGRSTLGVILIRLEGLSASRKAEIVVTTVRQHENMLINNLVVVSPRGVRVHRRIS